MIHTSSNNPLFTSSKYNGLENKIRIHFSKLVVTLQLEALLSIMRFQDNIMLKWPKDIFQEQEKNKKMSTIEKFVKDNSKNCFYEYYRMNFCYFKIYRLQLHSKSKLI
jgi:hypothetical protein